MSKPALSAVRHRPLRVMHVVDSLTLSGMEYGVIKLVNRLDPERFTPLIACLRDQRLETRPLLDERVRVLELRKPPGRDWSIIGKLARLLRREEVDIVHSHNWPTYLYTVAAALRARVPVIIHGEHGRETSDVSGKRRVVSRLLARWVTHLTTVNEDIAREVIRLWKVPPERVTAVRNGVDLEMFGAAVADAALRAELGIAPSQRVLLSIGGLRPVKDYPTLLRAFARLAAVGIGAHLLVVGSDQGSGARTELERLADELGIGEMTSFLGVRHDVPRLLALADTYVNSSVYEGMSNTILEAMAAGKPVVATAVGGSSELVREGETGYLVPPGDPAALGSALIRLLSDPEEARRLGEAGRRVVESRHGMEAMVRGYGDLYRELLERRRWTKERRLGTRIREWVARALRLSGLNLLRRRLAPRRLTVLVYGRVCPLPEARGAPPSEAVTPRDLFEAQLSHLSRHYRILRLEEALRSLEQRRLLPDSVSLVFEEAGRENEIHAWPCLVKYGLPATLVLNPGAVQEGPRRPDSRLAEQGIDLGAAGSLAGKTSARIRRVDVRTLGAGAGLDCSVLDAVLAGWFRAGRG